MLGVFFLTKTLIENCCFWIFFESTKGGPLEVHWCPQFASTNVSQSGGMTKIPSRSPRVNTWSQGLCIIEWKHHTHHSHPFPLIPSPNNSDAFSRWMQRRCQWIRRPRCSWMFGMFGMVWLFGQGGLVVPISLNIVWDGDDSADEQIDHLLYLLSEWLNLKLFSSGPIV